MASKNLLDLRAELLNATRALAADGPACFNTSADTSATVSIDPGMCTPSWEGTLVLGNGSNASPSGAYSLNPQRASSDSTDYSLRQRNAANHFRVGA